MAACRREKKEKKKKKKKKEKKKKKQQHSKTLHLTLSLWLSNTWVLSCQPGW